MKTAVFLLSILAISTLVVADVKEEDDVMVLNKSNFDDVISTYDRVLVEFYAPWCGHCKKIAPEYSKAAKTLKEDKIKIPFAKVDATAEIELAAKYNIQGYPTIKYFVQGKPVDYTGGRTSSDFSSWVRKRSSAISTKIASVSQLEKLVADNKLYAVYLGSEDSDSYKAYTRAAMGFDDIVFGHSSDSSVRSHTGAVPGETCIVLYKTFDEGKAMYYGPHEDALISKFLDDNQYQTVMHFDQKAAEKIFGRNLETMFIVGKSDDSSTRSAVEAMKDASKGLKGKLELCYAYYDDSLGKRLSDFLGLTSSQLPQVRIIRFEGEDIKKYSPTTSYISSDSLLNFYTDYRTGKSKVNYKSEDIPKNKDTPVKVVVGKTFNDIVYDSSKDVFVDFYAPWCGHCKSLEPIFASVAEKLKKNPNIVLAKIDATANEIEGIAISGFPTLRLFPANNKKNPIEYNGDRTEEAIIEFLKKSATHKWVGHGEL